jgi:hypothetical protein
MEKPTVGLKARSIPADDLKPCNADGGGKQEVHVRIG